MIILQASFVSENLAQKEDMYHDSYVNLDLLNQFSIY